MVKKVIIFIMDLETLTEKDNNFEYDSFYQEFEDDRISIMMPFLLQSNEGYPTTLCVYIIPCTGCMLVENDLRPMGIPSPWAQEHLTKDH